LDERNIWKSVAFLIGLPLLLIVILVALLVESSVEAVAPVEEKLKESENPKYDFFAEVPNGRSDDEKDSAHIYRVEGKSVEEISKHIQSLQKPKQQAVPFYHRHLLAYPEALVTVYQDLDDPSDVLVEVAPEEFVREQYHPQLFTEETDLFDDDPFDMPKFHAYRSYYTGFINWDRQYTRYPYFVEENRSSTTSIRNGSAGTRSSRGGGISAGK